MSKNKIYFFIKLAISLFLLYLIVRKIDFSHFKEVSFSWPFIILMVIISAFMMVLRMLKWEEILTHLYKLKISMKKIMSILLVGQFFSFFTPGRVGDFVRIKYIKPKLGLKHSFFAVLFDRLLDVLTMCFFFILGLLYFKDKLIPLISAYLGAKLFLWLIIATILLVVSAFVILFILYKKNRKFFSNFFKELNLKRLVAPSVLSIVIWFLNYVQFYLASLAIGLNVGFIPLILIAALHSLLSLIPITIAGVGLRELLAISLFPLLLLNSVQSLVIVWLAALSTPFLQAIVGGIMFILEKKG